MRARVKRNGRFAALVATTTCAFFLNGCLGSALSGPPTRLDSDSGIEENIVLSDVMGERGMFGFYRGGFPRFNLVLMKECERSGLFPRLHRERDVPVSGLDGETFLVVFRVQDYRHHVSLGAGNIAVLSLSFLIVPMFFLGLARNDGLVKMDVHMKVYDVTGDRLERIKDEFVSAWFNQYDLSDQGHLVSRTYPLEVAYASGYDDALEADRFSDELTAELARQLLEQALPDIQKVISSKPHRVTRNKTTPGRTSRTAQRPTP